MSRRALPLVLLASGSFALALLLASVGLPEYSHRVHPVMRGPVGDPQVPHPQQRLFGLFGLCSLFGHAAAHSPSMARAIRLTDSTSAASTRPGRVVSHHALAR